MLKTRLFTSLVLLAITLAACATPGGSVSPSQTVIEPSPTVLSAPANSTPTAPTAPAPTEALVPSPLPLATSRGPDLHATDPTTVNLASGGLQLVELFRFT
jgi:hypothetical protein